MASVEELLIKLTVDNAQMKAKLAESEKSVKGFGSQIAKIGPMMLAAFSVTAIAAFAQKAYMASVQQEQANKRLLFSLHGNTIAFKQLTDQAEDLRQATGVDDAAIMQIQQLGASAGKSTQDIKKITEATVKLCVVSI